MMQDKSRDGQIKSFLTRLDFRCKYFLPQNTSKKRSIEIVKKLKNIILVRLSFDLSRH